MRGGVTHGGADLRNGLFDCINGGGRMAKRFKNGAIAAGLAAILLLSGPARANSAWITIYQISGASMPGNVVFITTNGVAACTGSPFGGGWLYYNGGPESN